MASTRQVDGCFRASHIIEGKLSLQEWITVTGGAVPLGIDPPFKRAVTPQAVSEILSEMEGGGDWHEGVDRLWHLLARKARPALPPPDGRLNWTWLTDLDDLRSAVDLGSPFGEVAATLALEFPRIRYIGSDSLHGRVVAARMTSHVPTVRVDTSPGADELDDSDLVVFVAACGWRERLPERFAVESLPVRARALLRPGGWMAAVVPNPTWYYRYRNWDSAARFLEDLRVLRTLRTGMIRNGFSEVREYLTAPDFGLPERFIPNRRNAVMAVLKAMRKDGYHQTIARLGIGAPLFPARLLLGRR